MRVKDSPRGGKVVRSAGAAGDDATSPKRRGGTEERKESDRAVRGKSEAGNNDSGGRNVSAGNGAVASKSIPIDDVVMEVKSSLSAKLDTATILKDLEEKRRQQPRIPEDSINVVPVGLAASETGVGLKTKGFKKPAKRASKERTATGDDVSEEEETEMIDDWRDDIKAQGREKAKSKDRKERMASKRSKDEEERAGVGTVAGPRGERDVQNGRESSVAKEAVSEKSVVPPVRESGMSGRGAHGGDDSDGGRWGSADIMNDSGVAESRQGEGSVQRMLPSGDRARGSAGALTETRRVTENVYLATTEISKAEVKEKVVEESVVTEKVVSSSMREEVVISEVGGEKSSAVKSLKDAEVVEEGPTHGKSRVRADDEMDEGSDDEKKRERTAVEVSEGDEERERRAGKRPREVDDEEERDKRRRKKSHETGGEDEEEERHRERHRRHQRKHRHEGDAEKGEAEDKEKEDAEQRRERRRHKKKHRKDESEKREKKRRKHRHRRKRTPSESPELSPSGADKTKRGDEDDGSSKHKQQRSRHVRSPSVEAEKGAVDSADEGATRKRSSSRHRKKRRDPSKSASESPSSSE